MHNLESPTLTPLLGVGGVTRYEVQRISIDCTDKEQRALSYESSGRVTTNHKNCWVHNDILQADVPAMVAAYDTNPSTLMTRERATQGYKT